MGDPCDEDWDEDLDIFDDAPTSSETGSFARAQPSGDSFEEPARLVQRDSTETAIREAVEKKKRDAAYLKKFEETRKIFLKGHIKEEVEDEDEIKRKEEEEKRKREMRAIDRLQMDEGVRKMLCESALERTDRSKRRKELEIKREEREERERERTAEEGRIQLLEDFNQRVEKETQKRVELEKKAWIEECVEVRKRKEAEEAARLLREQDEERQRQERARYEADEMLAVQLSAEQEEKEADAEVKRREQLYRDMSVARRAENAKNQEKEKEELEKIEKIKVELEESQTRLREVRAADAASKKLLEDEKTAVESAQKIAAEKKKARLAATREVDQHPYTQSALHFSRACTICVNDNPRERAVMNVCGHLTCVSCAEEMEEPQSSLISCPFCRARTTYTKLFENQEAPEARKRVNDGPVEEGSPAKKAKE